MSSDWTDIESDPGVFTELVKTIGVEDIQIEELMTLEPEETEWLQPIYGLIFLFKWTKDNEARETLVDYDPELFFANQVITNACATQAILSILMNSPEIKIGPTLTELKGFTVGMDP